MARSNQITPKLTKAKSQRKQQQQIAYCLFWRHKRLFKLVFYPKDRSMFGRNFQLLYYYTIHYLLMDFMNNLYTNFCFLVITRLIFILSSFFSCIKQLKIDIRCFNKYKKNYSTLLNWLDTFNTIESLTVHTDTLEVLLLLYLSILSKI